MIRLVVIAALLAGCVKQQQNPFGSSSSRSAGPTSYGSSSSTQVYRTTATGAPVSSPSTTGIGTKDTGGKGGARNELLRAGITTLAISYVTTVMIGQVVQATLIGDFETAMGAKGTISRLWVPVIGPWAALAYNEGTVRSNCESMAGVPGPWEFYNCDLMTESSVLVAVGALAQTTGLVLTFVALQRPPKPVKHEEKRVVITPHGSPNGVGVVFSGSF